MSEEVTVIDRYTMHPCAGARLGPTMHHMPMTGPVLATQPSASHPKVPPPIAILHSVETVAALQQVC
eukprot:10256158-Alexandrium_andersonii.AAC.1